MFCTSFHPTKTRLEDENYYADNLLLNFFSILQYFVITLTDNQMGSSLAKQKQNGLHSVCTILHETHSEYHLNITHPTSTVIYSCRIRTMECYSPSRHHLQHARVVTILLTLYIHRRKCLSFVVKTNCYPWLILHSKTSVEGKTSIQIRTPRIITMLN